MKVLRNCEKWAKLMRLGGDEGSRILANILKDECLRADVESWFFEKLSKMGIAETHEEARKMAIDVVRIEPDTFVCQGKKISETLFSELIRLEDVKALRWHLPEEHLKKFGIRDLKTMDLNWLSDDEISIIVNEYKGELNLGNLLDVVWVSDRSIAESFDIRQLVDKLGLANLENESRCLKIVYKRNKVKMTFHLPRSLDGINSGQFKVVEDCNASAGMTLPLRSYPDEGLPEAVHRGCEIKPEIFVVEKQ